MKGIYERPDMIQAIVDGRKTQTRRVIEPQLEDYRDGYPDGYDSPPHSMVKYKGKWIDDGDFIENYTRYRVGETVYIKEGLLRDHCFAEANYRDGSPVFIYNERLVRTRYILAWRWQKKAVSPLHCPREAARYFLTMVAVRAERLQKITLGDAIQEGVARLDPNWHTTALMDFQRLWDSINPKNPFDSNPWVWVYEFELQG